MYKVRHHGHGFAVDLLFARTVEMELQQVVDVFVDFEGATRLHIDLDGVPVVQDFEGAFFVSNSQHVFRLLKGSSDVERRLFGAFAAGRKLIAPFVRAHFAHIVPMCSMRFFTVTFIALDRTISQHLDFLTSCGERILRSTNGLET